MSGGRWRESSSREVEEVSKSDTVCGGEFAMRARFGENAQSLNDGEVSPAVGGLLLKQRGKEVKRKDELVSFDSVVSVVCPCVGRVCSAPFGDQAGGGAAGGIDL